MAASNRYSPSVCRGSRCGSRGSRFCDEKSFQFQSQVRREGLHRLEIRCFTLVSRVCHGSGREITVPAQHLRWQMQLYIFADWKTSQNYSWQKKTSPRFFEYVCYFPWIELNCEWIFSIHQNFLIARSPYDWLNELIKILLKLKVSKWKILIIVCESECGHFLSFKSEIWLIQNMGHFPKIVFLWTD